MIRTSISLPQEIKTKARNTLKISGKKQTKFSNEMYKEVL